MKKHITHITQITKQDLKDIADLINLHSGDGILISRTADGIEISIDQIQLYNYTKSSIYKI